MRFYGKVGYVSTDETAPGVYEEVITERRYYGDITRDNIATETGSQLNANFTISNQFSIVADNYAFNNLEFIRYVEYMGVKWSVSSVDIARPRLILHVKGRYND